MANGNGSFGSIAKQAPHWAALVLVVGLFMYYFDRHQMRNELVAEQRINTCHSVQAEATTVLRALSSHLQASAVEDAKMREQFQHFAYVLEEHTQAIEKLLTRMGEEP